MADLNTMAADGVRLMLLLDALASAGVEFTLRPNPANGRWLCQQQGEYEIESVTVLGAVEMLHRETLRHGVIRG